MLAGCQPRPDADEPSGADALELEEATDTMSDEAVVDEEPDEVLEAVDFSSLEAAFQNRIAAYADPSSVAVTFCALGGVSGGFDLNGDEPMVAASMIKLAILSDLFEKVQSGQCSLDQVLTVQPVDVVGGAGTGIKAGQSFTIRELANRMISESDNTASNALLSLLGLDDVNEHARRMGYDQIWLDHRFMSTNYKQDNLVSSDDLARILVDVADGSLGSLELSEMAEGFLLEQTDELGLFQGVPSGYTLGHKTGSLSTVRNDGGIFYGPTGEPSFVLVVLTNDVNANTANAMMADLASLACDEMTGLHG